MSVETLTRQMLTVLYENNAYWNRCGGPQDREGLTYDALLTALQQNYPNSNWDTQLLTLITRVGFRNGTIKIYDTLSATCPQKIEPPIPPINTMYYGNNAMIIERVTNNIYADISPRICNPCTRTYLGNVI